MVRRFLFGPVFFSQCRTFASPECLLEPATDVCRDLFVAVHLLAHELNSLLAYLADPFGLPCHCVHAQTKVSSISMLY
jgi:hypothetical protein